MQLPLRAAPGPVGLPSFQGHQPLTSKASPFLVLWPSLAGACSSAPECRDPAVQETSSAFHAGSLGVGAGEELSSGPRLQCSISLFPVDDIIAFLQPLTHVAFICFISRHEYTRWKLCLIAKLKTFGFPFLLDSLLVCCILFWVGFFWVVVVVCIVVLLLFQPPFLTKQREASDFLANCLGSICYIWDSSLLFSMGDGERGGVSMAHAIPLFWWLNSIS